MLPCHTWLHVCTHLFSSLRVQGSSRSRRARPARTALRKNKFAHMVEQYATMPAQAHPSVHDVCFIRVHACAVLQPGPIATLARGWPNHCSKCYIACGSCSQGLFVIVVLVTCNRLQFQQHSAVHVGLLLAWHVSLNLAA